MKVRLIPAGYCTHPEYITIRGGRRRTVPFYALFGLLEHPAHGPVLFDTGYSPRFYEETRRYPNRLYARVTPVFIRPEETARSRLAQLGVAPESVRYVILSHFHADHIGGLADFPAATYLYFSEAYAAVRARGRLGAVRAGFLRGLLPLDFERRSAPLQADRTLALPARCAPFDRGVDVFGDGSLIAVPLPGHAHGQMGLFLRPETDRPVLLAADACWHSRAFRELRPPHPATHLVMADSRAYRETLMKLHHLHRQHPDLLILPTHCPEVYERYTLRPDQDRVL